MAFLDLKLTESDFTGHTVAELPDDPTDQMTPQQLKARFDDIGQNVLGLGRLNQLIDRLEAWQAEVEARLQALEGVQTA